MTNKELNYVMICGVIRKKTGNKFVLDFGRGTIKVHCGNFDACNLHTGYTVHVGGFLSKRPFGKVFIEAFNVSIFDTSPHALFD